jgi:hypothetical protein
MDRFRQVERRENAVAGLWQLSLIEVDASQVCERVRLQSDITRLTIER